MTNKYIIPNLPLPYDLETVAVLKQLNKANKKLAELKGIARTIPNENILISMLAIQEARDSSALFLNYNEVSEQKTDTIESIVKWYVPQKKEKYPYNSQCVPKNIILGTHRGQYV